MARILDIIDCFALLESFGITVARSAYVDSAESGIVFANRRPISLYGLHPDGHSYDPSIHFAELHGDDAIRAAYRKLTATAGTRVFAQTEIENGSGIRLAGDERNGERILRLYAGSHQLEAHCPISEDRAESVLADLRSAKSIGSNEQAIRMLAHLFMKVSEMYEESGIADFILWIRVCDNSYKVTDAKMTAERMPEITKRLQRHAHDRWSYDYHPAGRPSLEPHTRDRR